jgi:hypothetical protein
MRIAQVANTQQLSKTAMLVSLVIQSQRTCDLTTSVDHWSNGVSVATISV